MGAGRPVRRLLSKCQMTVTRGNEEDGEKWSTLKVESNGFVTGLGYGM